MQTTKMPPKYNKAKLEQDILKHVQRMRGRNMDGKQGNKTGPCVNGALVRTSKMEKCPDAPKTPKTCLKTTPKAQKTQEIIKPSSDMCSKIPNLAKKPCRPCVNGALVHSSKMEKCPEAPKTPKICLKATPKPPEIIKPSSDMSSKIPKLAKKPGGPCVNGASVRTTSKMEKCPDAPKTPTICLKQTSKPQESQEIIEPSSDMSSEIPKLEKKPCQLLEKEVESPAPRKDKGLKDEFEAPKPKALDVSKSAASIISPKSFSSILPRGHMNAKTGRLFFYKGGRNGEDLIQNYCEKKGWTRIYDANTVDYKLKWCDRKCASHYSSFREGEQLLYQIPNDDLLTTKIGLLNTLRDYEDILLKVNEKSTSRILKMDDFYPETLRLDVEIERQQFFSHYRSGQTWISKPTGLNQGRGIYLIKNTQEVWNLRSELEATKKPLPKQQARIVQRYIEHPLLLEGRKFDVRSYFLIASTEPYFVFFRHGYVRLTCNQYNPRSRDLGRHLTNQYVQKQHPRYSEIKDETVWSMERLNSYINEMAAEKGLPQDWVFNVFTKKMQQIMKHCFMAVKSKLKHRRGYFDLIGCDFLIDENFKVWLLEMNCNPALDTNCKDLQEVIPSVINETLDLTLELFEKGKKHQPLMPLKSLNHFVLLYNGEQKNQRVPIQKTATSKHVIIRRKNTI